MFKSIEILVTEVKNLCMIATILIFKILELCKFIVIEVWISLRSLPMDRQNVHQ